jgi:hypothetical protein
MNDRSRHSSSVDEWFAIVAALLVLFTAMLDSRVSAILAVVILLGFALYKFTQRRPES